MTSRIQYNRKACEEQQRSNRFSEGSYCPLVEDKWRAAPMPLWLQETIATVGICVFVVSVIALLAMFS